MAQKVLLVDNDPQFLEILGELLSCRFQLVKAEDAQMGLDILNKDSEIDVVVADIFMEPENGIEFLVQAKKISPWAVGILISGQPTLDQVILAVNKANIFGIFTKGDPVDSLLDKIGQGLNTVQKARAVFKDSSSCLSRDEILFFQTLNISYNQKGSKSSAKSAGARNRKKDNLK